MATSDGDPARPQWLNWMYNVEEYKITIDMKYSGKINRIINLLYCLVSKI